MYKNYGEYKESIDIHQDINIDIYLWGSFSCKHQKPVLLICKWTCKRKLGSSSNLRMDKNTAIIEGQNKREWASVWRTILKCFFSKHCSSDWIPYMEIVSEFVWVKHARLSQRPRHNLTDSPIKKIGNRATDHCLS